MTAGRALLLGATALAAIMASVPVIVRAQSLGLENVQPTAGAQMLLEADTLTYDQDNSTVTTSGGVQIEYDGNRLVADKVVYNRKTRRLTAIGNVEILESDGNKIYADQIDVTDDFRDGFVNTLRIETPDKTYFAAQSGKRENGSLTTFNNGVYTACEPCEEKPGRPPIWRIKSRKIIWNQTEHTVRFEQARFELFGMPIAYAPFFQTADPTVKRKSGFLFPSFIQDDERGFGVRVPYYFALSPTYDLTVAGTPYSKQGFLGEAEWRQQFNNGDYSITIAGISQNDPGAWERNQVDSTVDQRGMIGTKGEFQINPRWVFGWDALLQSDKNFANTYDIAGYSDLVHRSQIYLTGLNDRNYFDLRAMHFDVQEELLDSHPRARDEVQPNVLPSFDYSYIPDEPVAGGQLTLTANAQALHRNEEDFIDDNFDPADPTTFDSLDGDRMPGPEGSSGRFTTEAEWERSFTTDNGIVITPLLAARADAIYANLSDPTVDRINGFTTAGQSVAADVQSAYWRYMATAGLEVRWPILFSTAHSSHVLEPMAQVFLRPDAPYQSTLGIPNEDAQSLVFDATDLFERDKFSGYDRIEGGTRANVGLRYSGVFDNGWGLNALIGQSYQLLGDNPFAQPDLVNAGAYSGLETDVSDYVGLFGVQSPIGFSGSIGMRLDEETFEMRRTDLTAAYTSIPFSARLQYAEIEAQPLYGFDEDRHEIRAMTSVRFLDNWSAFVDGVYDLESSTVTRKTIGFAYGDECFIYAMSYSQTRSPVNDRTKQTIGFHITLRTIGDFGSDTRKFDQEGS